jgi:putative nucleotidyltransferase with HDIG domain
VSQTHVDEKSGNFVVAPGGYRIRVPHPEDVHQSVHEMLPSVRQGLSVVPPLPQAVVRMLKEIQDPNASAASVATIAASDGALAASLIRTVNSAAFGLHRKITSVSEAVSYLGFTSVKSLVLRLNLESALGGKAKSNDDVEDLWIHSLVVSYIGDCLARRVSGVDHGFVSTLGLLHDIGKLVIHTQFPAEAAQLRRSKKDDGVEGLTEREYRILGIDHAELGATLAAKWALPGDLVKAIRWHHAPERAFEPGDPMPLHQAMHLMQIANQLAKYCYVYGDETEIDAVPDQAFDSLGFSHNLTALLTADVRAAASRAIFFADDGSSRAVTSVRRFLRLNRGESAASLMAALAGVSARSSQTKIDDQLCEAMFTAGPQTTRFSAAANASGLQKLSSDFKHAMDKTDLTDDARLATSLVARCVLANTLGAPGDKVEAAIGNVDGRIRFAVRAATISFANRFGQGCDGNKALLALDSELANVLNLGWFDAINTSSDGSTLVFTPRVA